MRISERRYHFEILLSVIFQKNIAKFAGHSIRCQNITAGFFIVGQRIENSHFLSSEACTMDEKKSGLDIAGLNIALGDRCSQTAYTWSKQTFRNRHNKAGAPCVDMDGMFSNMLDFHGTKIGISSDGIGTKIELAERTGIYTTLGYDLMAMTVDDLIAGGFEPTNISNILDVDVLDHDIIDHLMQGLHDAANEARVAISGGEIAELGSRICGYGDRMHFNWCATAIGTLHPALKQPITGSRIQTGDKVIALQSRGFRSNGFSLIRRTMQAQFGDAWHTAQYNETTTWGEALLRPSRIFAPVVCDVLSAGADLKGIAHITGGGIIDNFQRVLKTTKSGALLDNLFQPLEVMRKLQELGSITSDKAYRYWNMGNGMLLIVAEADVDKVLQCTNTAGYPAQCAGSIVVDQGITIKRG